jgi:hypothetical protein
MTRTVPEARRRRAAAGLLTSGIVIMLTSLAFALPAGADPKGNNGTIKIDGVALQGGQSNEPHVDCRFNLEFFGYDQGNLNASISFALQAPTRRAAGSQVLLTDSLPIGGDPAGGATDPDASKEYQLDFTGVNPHPQQGYHVKVTIHADGSQGADTKHKVFWVQPCEVTTTTTTTTTTTSTTSTTPTTTAASTTPTTTEILGVQETTTNSTPTQVLGEQLERAALPRTGTGIAGLAFLGGLALVLGGLISLLSKPGQPASLNSRP